MFFDLNIIWMFLTWKKKSKWLSYANTSRMKINYWLVQGGPCASIQLWTQYLPSTCRKGWALEWGQDTQQSPALGCAWAQAPACHCPSQPPQPMASFYSCLSGINTAFGNSLLLFSVLFSSSYMFFLVTSFIPMTLLWGEFFPQKKMCLSPNSRALECDLIWK